MHPLFKKYLLNQKGLSLVEAIIAVGIMAGIGMAINGILSNANKSEKMMSSRFNARQFYDELAETLKESQCSIPELLVDGLSFTSKSWPEDTKISLPSGVVGSFFKIKTGDSYDSLLINTLEIGPYFDRVTSEFKYVGLDNADLSKANLIKGAINIKYTDKTTRNRTPAPLNLPIYITLNRNTNKIISCSFANKMDLLADFCESVSGEWDGATMSCTLPCPAGSVKIDGRCEAEDKALGSVCSPTDTCGVTNANNIL